MPEVLPETNDLRAALAILEAQAAPATPKHVAWCLAKLMMAFEPQTKLSGDETKLRAAVWVEACGDLGDELWSTATLAAIQTCKWMPKPAEFRALVAAKLDDRAKRLRRCREMLNGGRPKAEDRPALEAPTRLDRLRITRGLYEKHNRPNDVARIDREIAREVDALDGTARGITRTVAVTMVADERKPFAPADTPTNRRMAELAQAHREGKPAPDHRDVPEAAHGP